MAGALSPDDMWSPFKTLYQTVEQHLANPQAEGNFGDLEAALQRHRQNFISLLKNPPRDAKSREDLLRGVSEGITLPDVGHIVLSKDLVDESIIISDMFDLNEYFALQLLCTAQQQMPNNPGLTRGLVAVLLYYDGRKALVSTLKELFQARVGVSWCAEISPELLQLVTQYTDLLVNYDILLKILDLLEMLDLSKEIEKLSANRALGSPKHYRQILDLFEDIRMILATCLFNWSAQCGLSETVTLRLIDYLAKYELNGPRGGIDDVTLTLMMTLLYAFDLSVLQKREDGEEIVKNLPIIANENYISTVMDVLTNRWECEGLRAVAQFSLGLAMATLRLAPQNLQPHSVSAVDHDEMLVNEAIKGKVFDFLYHVVLENELCFKMEFFIRRFHILVTDFVELMHSKVTELRASADDTARTVQGYQDNGIEPPTQISRDFEMLLLIVGKLYASDQLTLCLCLEYWGPVETGSNYLRSSSRSVSLFKFVRLAGELLPPLLFVPYLKMLAGLSSCEQSARNTFNLLKQGSSISGRTAITWDHFFNSFTQYYTNLRQEQNPSMDTVYRNRALNRNISPQEIMGLQAVLELVRAVADNDEMARITICEQSTWSPLQIMVGLVGCSVIIPLKTDFIKTLASLSKSRETALQLWNCLEVSQIIHTIPSTAQFHNQGIETEIEQNESRNEVYPLTQAILELLYTLTKTAIPKNLGAGTRKPGLDPYFTFVVDKVFLRFFNRNYKEPAELWEVAERCLRILDLFLETYEVNPTDFTQETRNENPPPGFHVMVQMNTKSDTLKLILFIVDRVVNELDKYANIPGKKALEMSALHCLNIIERSLALQELFFDAHSVANSSLLLAGINKLLLGVNERTGKPDHMLRITKFATYRMWLPKHTLLAVRIISRVLRQPNVNGHLLGIFTMTESLKNEIRHGFVECLENESGGDTDDRTVDLEIKEAIMNLLSECLPQSAPNVAHYLLGFDITKDIRATRLQQPGVMGQTSMCTKSLVKILDANLEMIKARITTDALQEKLIETAYGLLYALCHNPKTSEVILRFLRSCGDFLCRHLSALPFPNVQSPQVLSQMTGLLKSVAIELKITAENNQVTLFSHLSKILLGHSLSSHQESMMMDMALVTNGNSSPHGISDSEQRLLLGQLFECLDFEVKTIEKPKWNVYDSAQIALLLQNCEIAVSGVGAKLIDIKKLNDILRDDFSTVQSTIAAGQRQSVVQEIESILLYALQINSHKKGAACTARFLEAWGQVTEILFSVAPTLALSVDTKQGLILDILQIILKKVVHVEIVAELANLCSSTVLLLLVNLRLCYMITAKETSKQTAVHFSLKTNTLNYKFILESIVEWIIVSGVASQKLRINLYASLLNFMHIIKGGTKKKDAELLGEHYVSRLDRSVRRFEDQRAQEDEVNYNQITFDVFSTCGDKLIDILCHDGSGGHDICRMLALSCIDMLLDMDSMSTCIQFISRRGYLAHIIDSLMKSDDQLCHVLETMPDNLKALYVYESKMAMLSRVGCSYAGAELLLEHQILGVLSGMRVLDLHPDFQNSATVANMFSAQAAFVPPIEKRYQQILLPALNVCDVILSTLGPENRSVVAQVAHFLFSHGDMIEFVLRAGTPFLSLGLLNELSVLTGLVARTASNALVTEVNSNQDLAAQLYRLQKQMMTLFPRFILSESVLKKINECQSMEGRKIKHIRLFLQITANLTLYARNAISNHSADHRATGILFSPNISEGMQSFDGRNNTLEVSPNLGIIITQLKCIVQHYRRENGVYKNLQQQWNSMTTFALDNKALQYYTNMKDNIKQKQEELKLCIFIAEHCLYLLWAHLDFYMLRALPVDTLQINNNWTSGSEGIVTASEAGWKVTAENIAGLKRSLISVLTEDFCNQIILMASEQSSAEKTFSDALLRRIKRLIQFVPVK
ncbi:nuclear pore complex protein Nup205 [Phlebotomus argentipes]|uniref:nuclear pore complex protein Nup205 n=1 Tax=Phlebotomus argentipes TaxID=94469 RepID=UPI0028936D36|nr:nuclear pore complex protein Nup205 [Phlebotomus argentipes]